MRRLSLYRLDAPQKFVGLSWMDNFDFQIRGFFGLRETCHLALHSRFATYAVGGL